MLCLSAVPDDRLELILVAPVALLGAVIPVNGTATSITLIDQAV